MSTTTLNDTKALVRDFHETVNHRIEIDQADRFLSPDFVMHWFPTPGADGVVDFDVTGWLDCVDGIHTAFDDFESVIDDEIAEGDKVVHRYHARGKHVRPIPVPIFPEPTGAETEVNVIAIYRVESDKIVEGWESWDLTNFLATMSGS